MTKDPVTAATIKAILHNKYKLPEWVGFDEYRPFTGWNATMNSIDFFAVGMYRKNRKIISFEIKTMRGDFIKDVQIFFGKHEHAMSLSHEFYYICPWGLIDPKEVPEQCGLMWIDTSNRIQIKKVAQLRNPTWIQDFEYLQGFLMRSQQTTNFSLIPVKYLGKEIPQDKFNELVKEKVEKEYRYRIDSEARKIFEEAEKKDKECSGLIKELRHIFWCSKEGENFNDVVLSHCRLAKTFILKGYGDPIQSAMDHMTEFKNLLDEIREKEDGKKTNGS